MKIPVLLPLVNCLGAIATYAYFSLFISPYCDELAAIPGWYPPLFFSTGTVLIVFGFSFGSRRWTKCLYDIGYRGIDLAAIDEPERTQIRKDALALPLKMTLVTAMVWVLAGFTFGLLEPMVTAWIFRIPTPDLVNSLRRFFGITVLGGGITTVILYFALENAWRPRIPRFFPEGNLDRMDNAFRLSIRKRFLIVFLSITLIPLPVIGMTLYDKIRALHMTDAITRSHLMTSLSFELTFVAADCLFITFILAYLLSKSITAPLLSIKEAIQEVGRNNLDVRLDILSNDELGEVAEGFNRMIAGLKENRDIKESFGKYVCKEIRDEILAGNTSLDGEMKRVTLLFSDLRNFTPFSEKHHPKEVLAIMNQYFNEMSQAITGQKGLILQYVGDEIEAVFGAPVAFDDHPDMAVKAALLMREKLEQLNKRLTRQGFEPVAHGIGIHSGAVLAGNIGSEERLSYALVGDTVNTASRIQGLTRIHGCDIIISQTTHSLLVDAYETEQLPPARLKGKEGNLIVYNLKGMS